MRVLGWTLLALVGGLALAFFGVAPTVVDRTLNRVDPPADALPVSESAQRVHDSLFVADLHADPLLWSRDLLVRIDHGHVDIPRLIAGGVALQVFAAPTQVPAGLNYEHNELGLDVVTALAIGQRWPRATWASPYERARHMAAILDRTAERSQGSFRVVRTIADLEQFEADRAQNRSQVAGLLAIEGLHALEGKIENVNGLFAAGYRMMGLTHFFDNELGGSAHGAEKGGLSPFGRQVVQRMQQLGIAIDLAHASPEMIDDVIAMSRLPLVVSHTGVRGTCDNVRNLSDDHLRAIARSGGVVGIGYWDAAICEVDIQGIIRAIAHVIGVAGIDHVGLGSDFDGATTTPFDTSELAQITQGLLNMGLREDFVAKVMGGNVLRVLKQTLPRTARR